MADRRDYVALEWVQGEIEETLKQAQYAVEAFVEAPDDTTRLEFSLSYIHQVYGTLQMVEFFGAALLAEEMELLNQAMLEGGVPANKDNLAVLMQAIIQLPNYLDQLKKGQNDLPIVILPLLNDLRASRGDALLSETALFSPDLSAAHRIVGEQDYTLFEKPQTAQLLRKLRQMYQLALLGWLKGQDVESSLEFLAKSVARVVKLTERTKISGLWRVADAFVVAVKAQKIQRSPATVKVLRDVDNSIKQLLADPIATVQAAPEDILLKNLLFYLAKIEADGNDRIEKIQQQFRLDTALPTEQQVRDQRAKLSGPDNQAVKSVVTALLEELARLKDSLDLMVRSQVQDTQRLSLLNTPLQQLCDTMAVVGLGNPRRVLSDQMALIKEAQQQLTLNDDGLLMDIAGALLYVESTLKGIVADSDLDVANRESNIDISNAYDAVIREARTGIEQVKDFIVEFIGGHFDSSLLSKAPEILSAVYGGLLMVPLNDASRILNAVNGYIEKKLIQDQYKPQWSEMDALADALVGVEYYLERISRDGNGTNIDILERAANSLSELGVNVFLTQKAMETGDSATQIDDQNIDSSSQSLNELTEQSFELEDVTFDSVPIEYSEDPFVGIAEDNSLDTGLSDTDDSSIETIIDFSSEEQDLSNNDEWEEFPIADIEESVFDETVTFDASSIELEDSNLDADLTPLGDSLELVDEFLDSPILVDQPTELSLSDDNSVIETTSVEEVDSSDDDLIDDEILEIFIEEAEEVLEAINEFFPLYKSDAANVMALGEFRRAFHTLKGSGRMVGASVIGETAWSVENMLNRLIDNSISRSDDLIRVVEEVTAEIPSLVEAFKLKLQPDESRTDSLREKADAISRGESISWAEGATDFLNSGVVSDNDLLSPGISSFETTEKYDFQDEISEFDDNDADTGLLTIFKNELASHIEFIQTYTSDYPVGHKLPDALQRALHTIKGSAHMASMEAIAETVNPMELLVRDWQESAQLASVEFIDTLVEMVALVKQFSNDEPSLNIPSEVIAFVERVQAFRSNTALISQESGSDDVSLMSIFLSESMDIVMDAEGILERWRDTGQSGDSTQILITELDTLAQAAKAVDLMPLSQLSNELGSLYIAAQANNYIIGEKFFTLAYDGHESLISMMDRLAAGQSIRTDALFSERVKQLYELYGLPYEIVAPIENNPSLQPIEEVTEAEAEYTEFEVRPEVAPEIIVPSSLPAAERFMVEGDPELVGIFLEEANDILESIQQSLDIWRVEPSNTLEVESLQRDLHTLKGGARMAEVTPLGDLAHELEFLYEGLAQSQFQSSEGLLSLLQQCHDRLASMVGDIESSMTCMSAPDLVDAIARFRKNPGLPPEPVQLISVQDDFSSAIEEDSFDGIEQSTITPPVAQTDTSSVTFDQLDSEEAELEAQDIERMTATLPDDLDFDILEIFIEEAGELLHELEVAIEDWRSDVTNEAHADEMKRVLHTLKGGARLARLVDLGDQSHDFETFVVKSQQDRAQLNEGFFNEILKRQDSLVHYVELLHKVLSLQGDISGGFGPSVIQMVPDLDSNDSPAYTAGPIERESEIDDVQVDNQLTVVADSNDGSSSNVLPFKAKAEPKAAAKQKPQETVKVNASLLEGLVNLAGETSISRARLEQEVSDFSFTLGDMDQTIDRLRDHVRRLDMETEAQIIFRQERAEETNYEDFDPLEMDRYSQIQQLSRSLMEATYDLQDIKTTLTDKTRDAETILLQQSRINTELQEGLMRTRMVPFNRLLPRLRRIVRQVSGELQKQVDFAVGNAEGEVDRSVLERMISPLEHLLRNAVDHGIELPDARIAAGKNANGIVRLDLSREGSEIVLRLEDDGNGIDVEVIRQKAIERGLMSENADLNESEIMQFILEAGFSTAQKVTQISGRGVGMDVVNSEVKQLGGSIYIDSEPGKGTAFTIRLPFTVSVNRALMVKSQDDLYALPLTSIEGIVRVTPKQLEEYYQPNAPLFEYGGSRYRLEYIGAMLRTSGRPNVAMIESSVPLVLVRGSDDRHSMALHVDQLLGSREIVVKTLGAQFNKVPGVTGATILGDGSVVVILDLSALIRSDLVVEQLSRNTIDAIGHESERKKEGPARIMVCDDSVTVRKVTSRLLERNGMDVMLAKHGADAIALMIDEIPDLILLDIEMPYMDGFEVASRVRHDERLKHIPIIMITSRTGSKHRERAISIGVNEYMGKPFQEGPLLESISRLLDES